MHGNKRYTIPSKADGHVNIQQEHRVGVRGSIGVAVLTEDHPSWQYQTNGVNSNTSNQREKTSFGKVLWLITTLLIFRSPPEYKLKAGHQVHNLVLCSSFPMLQCRQRLQVSIQYPSPIPPCARKLKAKKLYSPFAPYCSLCIACPLPSSREFPPIPTMRTFTERSHRFISRPRLCL